MELIEEDSSSSESINEFERDIIQMIGNMTIDAPGP